MADIGLVGLGVMGSNLALNMAEKGYTVAVHNRTTVEDRRLHGQCRRRWPRGWCRARRSTELAAAITPPRPIVIMVQAGAAGRRAGREDRRKVWPRATC